MTRPIRQRDLAIGLHSPQGDDAVPDGQAATVDLIALDAAGKRIAAKGLRWELVRERWHYEWYSTGGKLAAPGDRARRADRDRGHGRYRRRAGASVARHGARPTIAGR